MILKYAVTLEYDVKAPETARGELDVHNARQAARKAVNEALKQYPKRTWRSLVVVLERLEQVDI